MTAPRQRRGRVELAVARTLRGLDETSAVHEGLAASALVLAAKLDGDAGLATAAVARELRATLMALAEKGSGGDADDGAVAELLTRLSSPVGDAADS